MSNSAQVDIGSQRSLSESDALFLSIGDGALVTNESGEVTRINQAALDILGLKRQDVVGQWYADVLIAEDDKGQRIANINRPMTEVFLTGRPVTRRMNYRHANDGAIPVVLTVAPVMHENGPIGAIEVFRDISQEVELERAKDEFIALASHQLRTPATGVKQYIGMVLQGYTGTLTAEQKTMLRRAYEANERQLTIISDLLKVARVDAGKIILDMKQVRIGRFIETIVQEHSAQLKKRSQSIAYKPDTDVVLRIDPHYLRMVFDNLIDNASKYSSDGSEINIQLKSRPNSLAILIEDQGIGIKSEDLERVFQKFYRLTNPASSEVSGTGLGLYWVKQIMDLHGGAINVQSETNKGTTFTLTLPR